nr:MAG TPA: hypothetical protein [Crassvirales sp.]
MEMRGVEPLYCHLLIINFYMLFCDYSHRAE